MRLKIYSILLLVLIGNFCSAQKYYNRTNGQTTPVDPHLGVTLSFKGPVIGDTTSALALAGIDSVGLMFLQPGSGILWVRDSILTGGHKWSKIGDTSTTSAAAVLDSIRWGHIKGSLPDQLDLQNALNGKQNVITTGISSQFMNGLLFPTNFSTVGLSSLSNDAGFITTVLDSNSIVGNGVTTKLRLVNDVTAPGAGYVYMTDTITGVKGWYPRSMIGATGGGSGSITSIATASPVTGGTITSTGTIGVDTLSSHLYGLATYYQLGLKLNKTDTVAMVGRLVKYTDSTVKYVTPTQLASQFISNYPSNVGAGYRWVLAGTKNIRSTVPVSNAGILIDSTSNANALSFKVDSSLFATKWYVTHSPDTIKLAKKGTGKTVLYSSSAGDTLFHKTFANTSTISFSTNTDSSLAATGLYAGSNSIALSTATFSLVNDNNAPGNNYIYSTNNSGTKGWNALTSFPTATSSTAGLMSALDKRKLDSTIKVFNDPFYSSLDSIAVAAPTLDSFFFKRFEITGPVTDNSDIHKNSWTINALGTTWSGNQAITGGSNTLTINTTGQLKWNTDTLATRAYARSVSGTGGIQVSDTASMLSPYLRKFDTTAMLSKYLRKFDTTAMLLPYLREIDTASLSSRINLKLNISDTANKWIVSIKRSHDSVYYYKNNTWALGFIDSVGTGGSGNTNSNVGSAFRWAIPGTNNIKTFNATSPLSLDSSTSNQLNINIANAAADGSTKGAATFTANDFNASSGNISLDYTNGQKATSSVPGFLSSTDWSTFNNKQSALTFSTGLTNTSGTITNDLSTGVSGGQTVKGGTAASDDLTLTSTNHATKDKIYFGSAQANYYDEANEQLRLVKNSLSTTQTETNGLFLQNTTAAASGAQQISPALTFEGQGWKTNSTAASQRVNARMYLVPVQGAANPTSQWKYEFAVNGGSYSSSGLGINSDGSLTIGTSGTCNFTSAGILNFSGSAAWNISGSATASTAGSISMTSSGGFLQGTQVRQYLGLDANSASLLGLTLTNPTQFNYYNTYTSSSNYERGSVGFVANSNIFSIATQVGTLGTIRPISIYTGSNSNQLYLTTNGHTLLNTSTDHSKVFSLNGAFWMNKDSLPISSASTAQMVIFDTATQTFARQDIPSVGSFTSIASSGSAPSGVAGVGAGTGASVNVATNSNNVAGNIGVTTGSSPSANSIICTVTLGVTFPHNTIVVITPANAVTAVLSGSTAVWVDKGNNYFTINSNSSAIAASTGYAWNYQVIGN